MCAMLILRRVQMVGTNQVQWRRNSKGHPAIGVALQRRRPKHGSFERKHRSASGWLLKRRHDDDNIAAIVCVPTPCAYVSSGPQGQRSANLLNKAFRPYLQDFFIGLSNGVLERTVPLSRLLHLSLGLFHLLFELPQPPSGSGELSLVLLNLALLLNLFGLQRQDLERTTIDSQLLERSKTPQDCM